MPLQASALTPGPPHRVQREGLLLGGTIDHWLSWRLTANDLHTSNRKVLGAARSLLARGHGCTPAPALRVYNTVASARVIYTLR
ncbi:hypothetical protein MRX96_017773 [Rhipicephalus microplus]